jgi:hypothetical protein
MDVLCILRHPGTAPDPIQGLNRDREAIARHWVPARPRIESGAVRDDDVFLFKFQIPSSRRGPGVTRGSAGTQPQPERADA